METEVLPTTHVRFTRDEYLQIHRDKISTGKTIPWLLKTTYFKKGISEPALDPETRKAVRREIAYIGNNINQLTRHVNSGLIANVKDEVAEILKSIQVLRSFLGRHYGDSENSL